MKKSHRQQVENARVQIEVEKLLGERDRRIDSNSFFDSAEGGALLDNIGQQFGAQVAGAAPGSALGMMREANAIVLEHARQSRGAWSADASEPAPEPAVSQVVVTHPEAGRLVLRTDGRTWSLRMRAVDFGLAEVRRGEDGPDGLTPRPKVVAAAAARALSDPWGPESPPGSPVFYGNGPDGPSTTPPPVLPAPAAVKRSRRGLRRG
jgi:hypothetical protein